MKISTRQKLLLFAFIILAGIGLIGYGSYESSQKLHDSVQWVVRSKRIITQSEIILLHAIDMETASRGFVITKDSTYLEPLFMAEKASFENIRQLRQLTLDNRVQQQRVDSIFFYLTRRLAFSLKSVELRNKDGLASAVAYVSGGEGKEYSNHLRRLTDAFQKEEGNLLKERKLTELRSEAAFNRTSAILFILMVMFIILLVIAIGKYLAQNKEKEKWAAALIISNIAETAEFKNNEEYIGHLANIVEYSDDAIISKTLAGTIKSWNKGAEKIFGFTAKQAIGKNITLIIPPENINEEKMIIEKIRNNEIIDHYETIRIKKNGGQIYVSLTVSPLKDGAENIVGVSKIARDITEQKKIGEEVNKAYREKETVLNRISDGVVSVDNDWRYTFLNDVALATHPLSKQETLGKVIWDVHPEMKGTIFWDKYHEAMLTKKVVEIESYYSPMKIWLIVKIYPSDDGLTIFYEDVTKNKQAEKELSQTLKEVMDYKFALDEANIVSITNQKGIISYVNDNFCRISGFSQIELIGKDHRIINSGYHSKEFIKNLWATIANGIVWRDEIKNKNKDGSFYWVDATIVPILNEVGKPYQFIAIRTDITQRKKVEEEINILHEDLEMLVRERTEELESFSYSVSHDLRAPLRAVNGYTQMLKANYETQLDAEASRLMNNIMNNAKKMGQLIDDLLAFSRLGRRELVKMNIPVFEMVTAICNELKNEQDDRKIDFDIKQLSPARADNIALKQVWVNLISNAIKFSKLKEQTIIEIGSEIKGDEIIYYIKDNGAGFDMRYAGKLFNIFQRLHTDEEFEGTGVGLAIIQRIISKHGGRVWAEGKVNEGAVFYFTLNKS